MGLSKKSTQNSNAVLRHRGKSQKLGHLRKFGNERFDCDLEEDDDDVDISARCYQQATELGHKVSDKASKLGHKVSDKASELGHKVIDEASELRHKVIDEASEIGLKASELGHKVSDKASELGHKVYDEASEIGHKVFDEASELGHKVIEGCWELMHHHHLPDWLKDNEYLVTGHRPQLHSVSNCLYSIFKIHSETGNIWTHLIGTLTFLVMCGFFWSTHSLQFTWQEQVVYYIFFAGAISCMGFSTLVHTMYCHSEPVGKFLIKLDYCGIALLTMGSCIPWFYFVFYCSPGMRVGYVSLIVALGMLVMWVSFCNTFSQPKYRPLRAGLFVAFGCSAILPVSHCCYLHGFWPVMIDARLHWLIPMAFLYIGGATIYALRFPERILPGKFDIWFQSHQIFHVFVLAAALVGYHGINEIREFRQNRLDCEALTDGFL